MPEQRLGAVTVDTSGLDRKLRRIVRDQMPYAQQLALNDLAFKTSRIHRITAQQKFDRPTPYVIRSFVVAKKAKKTDLEAAVSGQGAGARIAGRDARTMQRVLEPQIRGGNRYYRSSEYRLRARGLMGWNQYLVGAEGALNKYGNVWGGTYRSMLAWFERGQGRWRYFIRPLGSNIGVFRQPRQRARTGVRRRKRRRLRPAPKLIWLMVSGVRYRPRFPFYRIAEQVADREAPRIGRRAVEYALQTAR